MLIDSMTRNLGSEVPVREGRNVGFNAQSASCGLSGTGDIVGTGTYAILVPNAPR